MSPKLWRVTVVERDGRCMKCNSVQDLQAHHIKQKATHPELILEVSNGITLCYGCHKKEHAANPPIKVGSANATRVSNKKMIRQLLSTIANQKDTIARLRKQCAGEPFEHELVGDKNGRCSHTKYCKWQK